MLGPASPYESSLMPSDLRDGILERCTSLERQQSLEQYPNHFGSMFTSRTFECVRSFKSVWTDNLQFPPVTISGTSDRDPPIAWPVSEYMLDGGLDISPVGKISGIVQFNKN